MTKIGVSLSLRKETSFGAKLDPQLQGLSMHLRSAESHCSLDCHNLLALMFKVIVVGLDTQANGQQ